MSPGLDRTCEEKGINRRNLENAEMLHRLSVVCLFAFTLVAKAHAESPPGDERKIQGTWSVISLQTGSKSLEEWEKAATKNLLVVFTGDKILIKGSQGKLEFTYKLDKGTNPKIIDLTEMGKGAIKGIYLLSGDDLKICVADYPGKKRPTEFKAKAGAEGQGLFVLRRKKP